MKKTDTYQIPVLMYHRVVNDRSEAGKHNIYVKLDHLRKQFNFIKRNSYQTITFKDLNSQNDLNKKIILTFDDGYVDNYTLLFPLLKEFNFTAVIFLVTKLTKNKWGIACGEPVIGLINEAQIKEMHAYGIEFGGHTRNHLNLLLLSSEQIRDEIFGSKTDIEKMLNTEVISFSYPFGALDENIKSIVKESGYLYGISTKSGPDNIFDDLLQIKRIEISNRTKLYRFRKKVSGDYFKPSLLNKFF